MRDVVVSYIVPAYNAEKTLALCLESILRQELEGRPTEVMVVDNGSTDSSREIARSRPVRLLAEDVPGAAAARNRGIDQARGDWIALVDADCVLPADWTAHALRALEGEPTACAVGGPGRIPEPGRAARCLNGLHYGLGPGTSRRHVRSLATMNVLFRGEVLRRYRFNQSLYMGEDPDLNLRLLEAGHHLVFDPSCEVAHYHPTTFAGILRKWFRYGLHYAMPYWRPARLFADPGFLPRLLYFPVLLVLALAARGPAGWLWAAGWVLAVPAAYALPGWRAVRGADRLVFPWLHAAKQWAQMAGMMTGLLLPFLRARRSAAGASARARKGPR